MASELENGSVLEGDSIYIGLKDVSHEGEKGEDFQYTIFVTSQSACIIEEYVTMGAWRRDTGELTKEAQYFKSLNVDRNLLDRWCLVLKVADSTVGAVERTFNMRLSLAEAEDFQRRERDYDNYLSSFRVHLLLKRLHKAGNLPKHPSPDSMMDFARCLGRYVRRDPEAREPRVWNDKSWIEAAAESSENLERESRAANASAAKTSDPYTRSPSPSRKRPMSKAPPSPGRNISSSSRHRAGQPSPEAHYEQRNFNGSHDSGKDSHQQRRYRQSSADSSTSEGVRYHQERRSYSRPPTHEGYRYVSPVEDFHHDERRGRSRRSAPREPSQSTRPTRQAQAASYDRQTPRKESEYPQTQYARVRQESEDRHLRDSFDRPSRARSSSIPIGGPPPQLPVYGNAPSDSRWEGQYWQRPPSVTLPTYGYAPVQGLYGTYNPGSRREERSRQGVNNRYHPPSASRTPYHEEAPNYVPVRRRDSHHERSRSRSGYHHDGSNAHSTRPPERPRRGSVTIEEQVFTDFMEDFMEDFTEVFDHFSTT